MKNRVLPSLRTYFAIPILGVAFAISGCAWLATSQAFADPETSYQAAYLEAQLAIAAGYFDGAIERLDPYVENEDCPPHLLTALAEAYVRDGQDDKSRVILDDTIARFPQFVDALRVRAMVNRLAGRNLDAIDDLEAALEVEPRNADLLEELGVLQYRTLEASIRKVGRRGAIQGLIDTYKRLEEVKRGTQKIAPLMILTSLHSEQGEHAQAIEAAKRAVDIRATHPRSQVSLAEAYVAAGEPERALQAYRQALLLDPLNTEVRKKVANLIRVQGKSGGLLSFYEELAESFPKLKEIQAAYGTELVKEREWDKAAEHFERSIALWPSDRAANTSLVVALFASGREDDGMKLARELLTNDVIEPDEMAGLAQLLAQMEKTEAALSLCRLVAGDVETSPDVAMAVAGVQIGAGRDQDAIDTLSQLIERESEYFPAVVMLGQLYTNSEQYDEAHALYDRALAQVKPEAINDVLMRKAELFRREGKETEAEQTLRRIVEAGGEIPEAALRILVDMYSRHGKTEAAHEVVDLFIASSGAEAAARGRYMKAWLLSRDKKYDEVVQILEQLHTETPADYSVSEFLVDTYGEIGEYGKAEGLISDAVSRLGADAAEDFLLLRARLLRKQGRDDEAIRIIESLLDAHTENGRLWQEAGHYYYEAGRLEDAERVLRHAIKVAPEDAENYNSLGYFYAETGINLDEAQELIEKALALNPGAGHIMDSLGWVFYMKGNYDQAVTHLESAIEKFGEMPDPVILEHLGDAYDKLGRSDDAERTWRRSLDIDPGRDSLRQRLGLEPTAN